jgi:predicted PurR-regulated permease PerM
MAVAAEAPPRRAAKENKLNGNRALMVLATIGVIFLLHWGQPFFVPLLVALLLSYALAPLVNGLTRVVRFRVLAAALVVFSIVGLAGLGAWAWSDDVEAAWQKLPAAAKTISKSLQKMAQRPGNPVAEVSKAAAEVDAIARSTSTKPAPPAPAPAAQPATPVWQVLWAGWKNVMVAVTQVMAVLFLVFFMLASGDLFKRKLMLMAGERLSERKDALRIIEEIDKQVRGYLGVLLIANILVGLGTWIAFHMLDVEYAGLWGLAAAVLHTAPYFGPAIIAAASLLAAFLQFGDWTMALMVSGSTIVVATVVGMVFTTWLASRSTDMNATASFVGLLFFGWIWDFWGVLLAIPILAIIKTICDANEDWKSVSELLSR